MSTTNFTPGFQLLVILKLKTLFFFCSQIKMLVIRTGSHKMLVWQGRPGSDCFFRSSPIRVFPVCYSGKHFVSSSPENQHFIWEQKKKRAQSFRIFTCFYLLIMHWWILDPNTPASPLDPCMEKHSLLCNNPRPPHVNYRKCNKISNTNCLRKRAYTNIADPDLKKQSD